MSASADKTKTTTKKHQYKSTPVNSPPKRKRFIQYHTHHDLTNQSSVCTGAIRDNEALFCFYHSSDTADQARDDEARNQVHDHLDEAPPPNNFQLPQSVFDFLKMRDKDRFKSEGC